MPSAAPAIAKKNSHLIIISYASLTPRILLLISHSVLPDSNLQTCHFQSEHQGHRTAARIAAEDGGTAKIIAQRRLFIGRFADIQQCSVRGGARQYGAPRFVDQRLELVPIQPAVVDPSQHGS